MPDTSPEARAAARNNAEWCHALCRSHGLPGEWSSDAWTTPRRSPPCYPDAVTLRPGAGPAAFLARVDRATAGCSVKDSFADLDLAPAGFRVLFEARWIHRPPSSATPDSSWRAVTTAAELADWQRAWHGGGEPPDLFRPALLADPAVRILADHRDGLITAGAVAALGGAAVGVSNVFTTPGCDQSPWPGLLGALAVSRPGLPVVGYEQGDDLAEALRHGFRAVGPLRVWLRTD